MRTWLSWYLMMRMSCGDVRLDTTKGRELPRMRCLSRRADGLESARYRFTFSGIQCHRNMCSDAMHAAQKKRKRNTILPLCILHRASLDRDASELLLGLIIRSSPLNQTSTDFSTLPPATLSPPESTFDSRLVQASVSCSVLERIMVQARGNVWDSRSFHDLRDILINISLTNQEALTSLLLAAGRVNLGDGCTNSPSNDEESLLG
jgi:hypothetical protein